jgi:NADH dehydrogenase FAD-containing subunit
MEREFMSRTVVVVGGGYGGAAVAKALEAEADVVLIDYLVLATGSSYAYPAKPTADSTVEAMDDFRQTHKELVGAGLTTSPPTEPGQVGTFTVTETLHVHGHERVCAVGDLTDIPEAKRAGHAMQHAEVVAKSITAQLRGEEPAATYQPLPHP